MEGTSLLPEKFLERLQVLLGDEFPAFLAGYEGPPVAGLRVNTLKITPDGFQERAPFPLAAIPWCPTGFRILGDEPGLARDPDQPPASPGRHPYHAAGLYYLQEPSAMAVVELLDPQPGEWVLDLAAAPGGKSTHLAARMGDRGLLVANEIHPRRVWELAENLERWGARQAAILNETPQRLAGYFGAAFDRVLVDAPCSGEGMLRKSAAARQEWSLERVESCALRQADILEAAADLVRPGGRLGYSTCTFAPEENEEILAHFLDRRPDFEIVALPAFSGYAQGRPDWVEASLRRPELARSLRLWPPRLPGEGHFVAVLERQAGGRPAARPPGMMSPEELPAAAARLWQDFLRDALVEAPEGGRLALAGSYLYQFPPAPLDFGPLKVIHPGWWLGSVKKNRFEPAHALALGLKAQAARRRVDLDLAGPHVGAYLRGETLPSPGEDGWTLVTVAGFPLGWGKRTAGVLKNFYPKGLRVL